MPRPEWIEVGRISRPHGVHGEVRVRLDSDNPERFMPGVTLLIEYPSWREDGPQAHPVPVGAGPPLGR